MDEFSFLDEEKFILDASDVAIGRPRPSDSIRSLNESELKTLMSCTGDSGEHNSIIAICEGRGSLSEIGLAVFNFQGSVCHLIQYADSSNYSRTLHMLTIYSPLRILMCYSSTENHRSKLYQNLLNIFPLETLCFLNRGDFNESKGREIIERLSLKRYLEGILFGCSKKYYAFAAISALFNYLEHDLNQNFISSTVKFIIQPSDGKLSLDYHTCKNLELVSSNCDESGSRSKSLFGILCKCLSPMGKRLLRSNILQPLTNLVEIKERQEAISLLIDREGDLQSLRDAIRNIPDIDRFISNIVRKENSLDPKSGDDMIHNALQLKSILKGVLAIERVLKATLLDCPLLASIGEVFTNLQISNLMNLISNDINEDISYCDKRSGLQHHQRLHAVKSTNNSLLEVARRTLKETQSDIYEYVEEWSSQIELSVEIKYQSKRGYYLSVSKASLGDRSIEGICSQSRRGRSDITFTTMDLIKLNGRVKESMAEVLLASHSVLHDLFDRVREVIDMIYDLSASVAQVDFICGLAVWALECGKVCAPEFDGNCLTLRNSRHPIFEDCSGGVVANDYFSCRGNSFSVITGANMSGKSTYCKQLALLTIMAQIGSWVPGDYASFPIYDRILTRLGSDDELESNASSFRMEMKESAYILEMISDASLVIIDELGRGTGVLEGMSLAMSICDFILESSHATVMFVTHFSSLVRYLKMHPKVTLIQLQSEISGISKSMRFLYQARSGVVEIEDYGMRLAEMAKLPQELLETSWRVLGDIKRTNGQGIESSGLRTNLNRRKLILQTYEKMKFIKESEKIDEAVKDEMLKNLKDEFEQKIQQE